MVPFEVISGSWSFTHRLGLDEHLHVCVSEKTWRVFDLLESELVRAACF